MEGTHDVQEGESHCTGDSGPAECGGRPVSGEEGSYGLEQVTLMWGVIYLVRKRRDDVGEDTLLLKIIWSCKEVNRDPALRPDFERLHRYRRSRPLELYLCCY